MVPFHFFFKKEYFTSNGFGNASRGRIENGRDCPVFHLPRQTFEISAGLKSLNPGIVSGPLAEKSVIMAGGMQDVGFKVQLVVEFYLDPLCLDQSQTRDYQKLT